MPPDWDHLREVETERYYNDERDIKEYIGSTHRSFTTRRTQFHAGTNFRTTKTKRFLSAEIEVGRISNFKFVDEVCYKWGASVVSDGSLGAHGFEINTSPASGNKFVDQISQLTDNLNANGSKITRSCGLHVHVDARDFEFQDIVKLIHLYAILEDGLFKVVARSRQRNNYCQKCGQDLLLQVKNYGHIEDNEEIVSRALYKADKTMIKEAKMYKDGGNRYRALNLHSWIHRGSVECRLHQGTTSKLKIINWATLWGVILDFAKANPNNDFSYLPTDSFSALMKVAQHSRLQKWLVSRYDSFYKA